MAVGLDAAIAPADGHVAVRTPRSHSSVLAMLVLVLMALLASGCATQTPALLAQPPTGLPSWGMVGLGLYVNGPSMKDPSSPLFYRKPA